MINVVTKSGTNDMHGSLFTYYRDNRLNANKWELNKIGKAKPPLRVWQFGGVASGPLVKDKVFWLFDYDAQRRNEPNPILCGTLAALCAAAAADPTLGPFVKDYRKTLDQDVYLGKGDWRISSNNSLSVRYNYQRFTGSAQENSGDTSVFQHTGDSLARTHTLAGNLISIFGPKSVNEFRAEWDRDSEPGTANGTTPEIQLKQPGTGKLYLQLGRNNFSPRETTIKAGQVVDNLTYLRGRHTFKFGGDFNIQHILNFFPGLFGGRYVFNCLEDFDDNMRPDGSTSVPGCGVGSFTQNFAGSGTTGPTTNPNVTEYSAFFQDEVRATSNLTLSFGLRYDLQTYAKPSIVNPDPQLVTLGVNTGQLNTDEKNFGPRVGFAWSPNLGRTTVIRGGYGIYYGTTPSILIATATSNNGLQVISVTIPGNLLPAGFAWPNTFSAPPTGATPSKSSLYAFDTSYRQPYVQQASLGAQTELSRNLSVGVTYLMVKGTHLTRSNNVNLLPAVATSFPISTGGSFTVQRYPGPAATDFGRITLFQSNANSIYHGFAFTMNKRFSHHFQALANYTVSRAIDDKPDSTSVVPGNPGDDLKMAQDHFGFSADRGFPTRTSGTALVWRGSGSSTT